MSYRFLGALFLAAGGLGGCQTMYTDAAGGRAPELATQYTDVPRATAMTDGSVEAPDPGGFIGFCTRRPDQCQETQTVLAAPLTPDNWARIQRINSDVNMTITPETDQAHYDRQEYWTIPTDGRGDCEDYALAKRQRLAEAGLPVSALRVAIALTDRDTLHAVLTVTTDRGDFVLDNLSNEIVAWNDSPYRWIERQNAATPWRWVSLLKDTDRRYIASLGEGLLTGGIE